MGRPNRKLTFTVDARGCFVDPNTNTAGGGYPLSCLGAGKYTATSRAVWEECFGPIPKGLFVLHKCDNPKCVNPEHLFLGTQKDNMEDKTRKGRQARGTRHGMAKLGESQVLAIRKSRGSATAIAVQFGVSATHVGRIRSGRSWATEEGEER